MPVRLALRLAVGEITYSIEGDRVILSKAEAGTAGDPLAVFGEWSSETDRRAYARL